MGRCSPYLKKLQEKARIGEGKKDGKKEEWKEGQRRLSAWGLKQFFREQHFGDFAEQARHYPAESNRVFQKVCRAGSYMIFDVNGKEKQQRGICCFSY